MLGIANMGTKPEDLEKSMLTEIEKVQKNGISEEEYKKLENQAENDFVEQNQKDLGVATNLATYYTFRGDANLINTDLDQYREVTKDDIKRVANKYLVKENRLVVYYLPMSEKDKKPSAKAERESGKPAPKSTGTPKTDVKKK